MLLSIEPSGWRHFRKEVRRTVRGIWTAALVVLLLMSPGMSKAGGRSWLFELSQIETISNSMTVIVLRPVGSGDAFPHTCDVLRIESQLERELPFFRTWSKSKVTEETYRQALSYLRSAHENNETVLFGSFGHGLDVQKDTGVCVARSRGLAVIPDDEGKETVFSFFSPT